jgi:uncharacterized protein YprB with RNaseH-like and TPR domain
MKLDRTLSKRLADLDRKPRPTGEEAISTAPPPDLAPPRSGSILTVGEPQTLRGSLEDLLPGRLRIGAEGAYWELVTPLSALGDWTGQAAEHWLQAMAAGRFPGSLLAMRKPAPEGVVFFDTETTGLNNEPLFLVGMLCQGQEEPYLRQLLARDYSEEPAVLVEARRLMAQAELVVSYNGNTFDVPYLQNRLRYHRLGKFEPSAHLDLLPVARRKLGRSLGNCKLQTLEQHLCRRERCNDIPGAQIPQAYHDFVADGEAGRLRQIIEHNSFDVITLAELAAHLA